MPDRPDGRRASGGLRLAFYGDDFTGSVDVLLQLHRCGLRAALWLGLPAAGELAAAAAEVDAIGVAGIARSLPVEHLDAEVRPVLAALAALAPQVLQYKACSTADSAPQRGSLGRALEIGREIVGPACVPMLFAQPDFGRYTAFGHHFAADDGVIYRLDRQPTMAHHPATPMGESDLARHLSRQTTLPLGHIPFTEYRDAEALRAQLAARPEAGVVLDALGDDHLDLIGRAIAGPREAGTTTFAIGSGGLTRAVGRAAARPAPTVPAPAGAAAGRGPVLVLSGSRSPQTARQIQAAIVRGWIERELSAATPQSHRAARDRAIDDLGHGADVVVTSGPAVASDSGLVGRLGTEFADLIEQALRRGVTRRIVVCGGDTASRVMAALPADSLTIAANPVGNVVLCTVSSPQAWLDGIEVVLKGGQVGPVDLFERIRRY